MRERNLEFLHGIDPSYYTYLVDVHTHQLEDDEYGLKAALSIRTTYAQAIETFFALLGALVQAPHCAYGWVLRYQNHELRSIVKKVLNYEPVLTLCTFKPTFENLSYAIHDHLSYDAEKKEWIANGFTRAWTRFARDFTDDNQVAEYNSAKHGLRARLGGFSMSIGREEVLCQPAPPEAMISMGGSRFGSSFHVPENLSAGKTNFRARQHSRNWVPENLINGVHLISMSISNVVSMLKIVNEVGPGNAFSTILTARKRLMRHGHSPAGSLVRAWIQSLNRATLGRSKNNISWIGTRGMGANRKVTGTRRMPELSQPNEGVFWQPEHVTQPVTPADRSLRSWWLDSSVRRQFERRETK